MEIMALFASPSLRQKLGEFMHDLDRHFVEHSDAGYRSSDPLHIRNARRVVDDWRQLSDDEREFFIGDRYDRP